MKALVLILAGCASGNSLVIDHANNMVEELQPQVVRELGTNDTPRAFTIVVSDLFGRLGATARGVDEVFLVLHEDWAERDSAEQRYVIAHELTHILGPRTTSYALNEGLADVIACLLVPELEEQVWVDHWVVQAQSNLVPEDLLRQGPSSDKEELELRALGFLALHALTHDERQNLISAPLAPERLLETRSWPTMLDLLRQTGAEHP